MKTIAKMTSVGVLVFGALASSLIPAHSAYPKSNGAAITKINFEGFQKCNSFGDRGYSATAGGIVDQGSARSGLRTFQIRTCFETRAQCEHFLGRIHHTISGIEELRYSNCKARA